MPLRRFHFVSSVFAASLLVGAAGFALAAPAPLAASSAPGSGKAPAVAVAQEADHRVVAKGTGIAIEVETLRARFAEVPRYQYEMFGKDPAEALRTFLKDVVIGDVLLERAAVDEKLDAPLRTRFDLARAKANALLRALHDAEKSGLSDAEVAAWYESHRSDFDAPLRISVQRILVGTKEEATALVKTLVDGGGKLANWNDVAREKSLDKGSSLRGGQLGFLFPDGKSTEAGVSVDAAIYAAAAKLTDGEIGKEPVPEGDKFAIVWRRGSIPATKRPLEEAKTQIRTVLGREKDAKAKADLIADLRKRYLTEFHPEKVEVIDIVAPLTVSDPKRSAPGAIPLPAQKP